VGSSNSVAAALDGVDRWTTIANVIWANAGTAHSWIVLQNTTLGYQVCIDASSAGSTVIEFSATEIGTPYTGGTTLNRPTSAREFAMGNTASAGTFTWISDVITGNSNWTHYVTADDGQFIFLCSRTGLNIFSTFMAMQKTAAASVGDTRNVFLMGHTIISGRGSPSYSYLNTAVSCTGRFPNGSVNASGGTQHSGTFGGTVWPGSIGVDNVTGNHLVFPLNVTSSSAGQPSYRGYLVDMYAVSTALIGGSIPTVAAQERTIAGDMIIPFPGIVPNV
jgi:hypothetical protein